MKLWVKSSERIGKNFAQTMELVIGWWLAQGSRFKFVPDGSAGEGQPNEYLQCLTF